MKKTNKYIATGVITLIGLMTAALALAQSTSTDNATSTHNRIAQELNRGEASSSSTNPQAIAKLIAQSDKELAPRIDALNKLIARVQEMKKITDSQKTAVISQIQALINNLNALKTKIDADTDVTVLRADLKSITVDYRIYALFLPQIQIIAASDRLATIVSDMAAIGTKLQARLATTQTAGKDVSSLLTTLSDIQSKLTDAQTQIQAAVNGVVGLAPDQGVQATMQSNTAALKQSRADLKAGETDLRAARKDAQTIMKGIKAFHLKTATSTASTTNQ